MIYCGHRKPLDPPRQASLSSYFNSITISCSTFDLLELWDVMYLCCSRNPTTNRMFAQCNAPIMPLIVSIHRILYWVLGTLWLWLLNSLVSVGLCWVLELVLFRVESNHLYRMFLSQGNEKADIYLLFFRKAKFKLVEYYT